MRSAAITGPGTTVSARTCSPRPSRAPSARSTPAGPSTRACSGSLARRHDDPAAHHRLGYAVGLDLITAALDPRAELAYRRGGLRRTAHFSHSLPITSAGHAVRVSNRRETRHGRIPE